jgi:hypothetical protein
LRVFAKRPPFDGQDDAIPTFIGGRLEGISAVSSLNFI